MNRLREFRTRSAQLTLATKKLARELDKNRISEKLTASLRRIGCVVQTETWLHCAGTVGTRKPKGIYRYHSRKQ